MNTKIFSFAVFAFLGLTAACSQAPVDGSADPSTDEGALATGTSKLVGSYTQTSDSGDVGFYAIQLRKSGTFHATGGCKPSDNGPHCFAIVEMDGKWTAQNGELDLVDQFDQTTKLSYSLNGDDLVLKKGAGAAATFGKATSGVVHPGGICKDGDKCTSGYECRSNCPKDAECIMAIDTCQPKVATVKAGGVCQLGPDSAPCGKGYSCKSNCPPGAMCIVALNVCQKD
ncbi:MAG: hypothetical protein U0235_32400 [Polyangiaceae bacterium]